MTENFNCKFYLPLSGEKRSPLAELKLVSASVSATAMRSAGGLSSMQCRPLGSERYRREAGFFGPLVISLDPRLRGGLKERLERSNKEHVRKALPAVVHTESVYASSLMLGFRKRNVGV